MIVCYFLRYCRNQYPDSGTSQDNVKDYILWRHSKGLDWQTINSDYSSIPFLYRLSL